MRYSIGETVKLTGATPRQIRSWVDNGLIEAEKRPAGEQMHNFFDAGEVDVMKVMVRLISAGLTKPETVASIARKHLRDVAVLREMGYASVSSSTEQSIGDGLVLMITG